MCWRWPPCSMISASWACPIRSSSSPDLLTADEWDAWSGAAHDRIGVEIVRTAFSSKELSEIIGCHHLRFDGATPRDALPNRPTLAGDDIPLRARILTIADAYDAMVSDRVYRQGRTPEQAFAELRSCAGKQFDPELVERLIQVVAANDQGRTELSSAVVCKQGARGSGSATDKRLADAASMPATSAIGRRWPAGWRPRRRSTACPKSRNWPPHCRKPPRTMPTSRRSSASRPNCWSSAVRPRAAHLNLVH